MPISDPTDISDCELWLAADNIVGLADGDPVATWADGSGNGRDATQGTSGSRPTYKTGILNSLPVIRLDGTDDEMTFAAGNFMSGSTAGELFVVVKLDADPAPSGKTGHPFAQVIGLAAHYTWTDGAIYEGFGTSSRKSTGNPSLDLSSDFRIYNVISASGEFTTNIDGTQHYTTSSNTVGWTAFTIGNGANGRTDGDIAEIIVYSRKLTTDERNDVLDYLDAKWFTAGGTTYNETGAGNLTIGGSASIQVTYNQAAAGGAIVGGNAAPQVASSHTAAGGIVAGGAAIVQADYNQAAAGGIAVAGAGAVQAVFGTGASGGVVIGGAADLGATEYNETGSGGAAMGGSSLVQATYGIEASGGLVAGGTALLGNQEFTEVGSGGAVLGGAAGVQQTSSLAGSGGAILSGTAAIEYVASVLGSGGVAVGGTAIVAGVYGIEAAGGIVMGGTALVSGTLGLTKFPGGGTLIATGRTGTLVAIGPTGTLRRGGT